MSTTKVQKLIVASTVVDQLNALSAKREVWEKDLFTRSNQALYELLADCLEMYTSIKGTAAESEILALIRTELDKIGIVSKKSSPVLTLIVRFVFRNDRRRAHSYSRALRVAVVDGITKGQFADWVSGQGGIEEVVRTHGVSEEVQQKQAELEATKLLVRQLLIQAVSAPIAVVPKTNLVTTADTGEYTLLIGKTLASGETQVLSVVPGTTEAMTNAAIEKIAMAIQKNLDKHNADAAAADFAKAFEAAMLKAEKVSVAA